MRKFLNILYILLFTFLLNMTYCYAIEETSSSNSSESSVIESSSSSEEIDSSTEIKSSSSNSDYKVSNEPQKKLSNNAYLKSLNISGGVITPKFSPYTTSYSITVSENTKSVSISASCNNCKSMSGLGNFKIGNGTLTKTIRVVAEDGITKRDYKVFITKKGNKEDDADNEYEKYEGSAYLKKLKVVGYKISPEFNKLNNKYTVIINKGENKINIDYEAVDNEAIVKIVGNKDLKIGQNEITINVKNGKKEESYILSVYKEKAKKKKVLKNTDEAKNLKKDKILIVLICSVAFLIIALSWYFIFIHKKFKFKNKIKKEMKKNKK